MAHFFFFFLLILSLLTIPSAHSNLFVEYIGALYTGVKFTDVPINPGITNFQFVLAFGIDYTASGPHTPTNGHFNVFWDNGNLGASQIAAIKASHPNVKVQPLLRRLLGRQRRLLAHRDHQPVPPRRHRHRLRALGQHRPGHLRRVHRAARNLPEEQRGGPSSSPRSRPSQGWTSTTRRSGGRKYGSVINHINYQFYAYDSSTTVSQFLGYFDAASAKYSGGNVLVSFSTQSPAGGLLPGKGFWRAADTLKSQGKLHGIFVWTADASKSNGFSWDSHAQSLLVN